LIAGLILLLTACGSSPAESQPASSLGDPARGQLLFDTGGASGIPCATCHTLDGTSLVGPSLKGIGDRAATQVAGLSAEDYIRQSILDPSAHLVEGYDDLMNKNYADSLSEQDINDLIAFLLTQ
jgi:cytochrome c oxidase subunit 2